MRASYFFGHDNGEETCYFCGNECNQRFTTKEYVKDTFTNRDIIKFPGAQYVCSGCVESLGSGSVKELVMIDGTVKPQRTSRSLAPRMYSWVLTEKTRTAATKAHIKELREVILNPPTPPFAIVLADSGQKQIVFRCPVAYAQDNYPVLLEEEVIIVDIERLKEYLEIVTRLSAAVGKVALLEPHSVSVVTRLCEYYGESFVELYERWVDIYRQPLARLGAWLCKNKEEASNEYPSMVSREIPAGTGSTNKPKSTDRNRKKGGDKAILHQVSLFDA